MQFDQFIIFFLLILTGFLCKKFKVFTDPVVNGINTFVVYISFPCLILGRISMLEMDHTVFLNFLLAIFISLGLYFVFAGYARLFFKGKRFNTTDRPAMELAAIIPNNAFMGFPIGIIYFGNIGFLNMLANNIASNIFIFSYGVSVLNRGSEKTNHPISKKNTKFFRIFINPNICAAIAGIIICYNQIRLPDAAAGFLDTVGAVATPMAMISVGTMLAGSFGLHTFTKRAVLEPMLNKLFILPLLTAAIVWFLPLAPIVKTILILVNLLPTGTVIPVLCEQYGRDKETASEILVISTLLSMVTIPLAIWVLGMIGL